MTMSGETLHKPAGSRRPRLWELEHKSHCPIVGVCFDVAEIRKLVLRLMTFPHRPNDFELHVTAVQQCEVRTPLSSLLQKKLERKYGLQLQRSKAAASVEQLREFWRAAVAAGDVAGTLWAVLSHAACSAELTGSAWSSVATCSCSARMRCWGASWRRSSSVSLNTARSAPMSWRPAENSWRRPRWRWCSMPAWRRARRKNWTISGAMRPILKNGCA
jgi:hypothetical protein